MSKRLLTLWVLMGTTLLFCFAIAAFAQSPRAKPASPQAGPPSQLAPIPIPQPGDLLSVQGNEYKRLLLEENKQHIEFLNRRVEQTFQWLSYGLTAVAVMLTLVIFLSYKSIADFKKAIREKAERDTTASTQKLLATVEEQVKRKTDGEIDHLNKTITSKAKEMDSRAEVADQANQRRRDKYASTLKQFLDVLMQINPNAVMRLCDTNPEWLADLKDKKALWVDDDPVSSVLPVAILERLGMQVTQAASTDIALKCDLSTLDLIVTNMNREPIPDAGLILARTIRHGHHSEIPILIFTRPERLKNCNSEIDALKVEYATEIPELILKLASRCRGGEDQHITPL